MNEILVSVVMPVYNVENYLEQCLNSLLNQTMKEIEIICVDDGSTDRSLEILESYSRMDERIRIIRQGNLYAGVARNNGMKEAEGEYIIFLDSDDFFEPEMLKTMYQQAKLVNADVCLCGGRTYHDEDGIYKDAPHYLKTRMIPNRSFFSPEEIAEYIFNFVSPAPWTKLFRFDYIRKLGISFQNTQRTNDLYFIYTALVCSKRITAINEQFVNYRTGNSSSLQATNAMSPFDFYDALRLLRKELYNRKLYNKYEKSYKNLVLDTCIYNLNRASNYDDFAIICEKLRNEIFYEMELIGHTRPYFHAKANFTILLDIMGKSTQDVWEKKLQKDRKVEEEIFPLINIDNWVNSFDYNDTEIETKISVIIPVYNVERYLSECLESIVNQTMKEIEIICVNDGSTDSSGDILKEYANRDSRFHIINKENGGASTARNAGLDIANGEYVYFMDSDDILDLRTLEFLYSNVKKDNLDQLYFSAEVFSDDLQSEAYKRYQTYYIRKHDYSYLMSGKEMFELFVKYGEFKPSVPLQIQKRSFLQENHLRFMPGIMHEDQLFTIQCLALAKRVRYENINLYKRRVRENSVMTGTANFFFAYSLLKNVEAISKFADENKLGEDHAYFNALLIQMERLCDSAGNKVIEINPEILEQELHKLTEGDQINFKFYIYAIMKLKRQWRNERNRSNQMAEYATVCEYKWQYRVEKMNGRIFDVECKHSDQLKEVEHEYSIQLMHNKSELTQTKKELAVTSLKLSQMENSASYRIGRILTLLPRKLRDLISGRK